MTQTELEQVARHLRDIGLHASWNELMVFTQEVVGSLVDAYQTLLRQTNAQGNIPAWPNDMQVIHDSLTRSLTFLASPAQVTRWEMEIKGSDSTIRPREKTRQARKYKL